MEARRASLTLALAMALLLVAGCEDATRLRAENEVLRQKLDQQAGKRQAELEFMEKQAGIAAGCDWLIALCPASVTAPGRKAQAEGFGGGNSFSFWLAFVGKCMAVGVFMASLAGVIAWLWVRLGRPEAEAVAKAEALVEQAGELTRAAQEQVVQAEGTAVRLNRANEEAQVALKHLLDQLAAGRTALEVQKKEAEAIKVAQDALTAFD